MSISQIKNLNRRLENLTKESSSELDKLCGNDDSCAKDANNDADSDHICGNNEDCPFDNENDADSDNICGNIDSCPYDAANDKDKDKDYIDLTANDDQITRDLLSKFCLFS